MKQLIQYLKNRFFMKWFLVHVFYYNKDGIMVADNIVPVKERVYPNQVTLSINLLDRYRKENPKNELGVNRVTFDIPERITFKEILAWQMVTPEMRKFLLDVNEEMIDDKARQATEQPAWKRTRIQGKNTKPRSRALK